MIDYLSEVAPLESQLSDEQIAEHLNSKTQMPLMPDPAKYELADSGAVLQDPVRINERSGSLIDYYQALEAGDSKDLIAFALGRIYGGESVSLDEYPRSVQFASVMATLPKDLQDVAARLIAVAGGHVHQDVSVSDIEASRVAWEQSEADRIAAEKEQQAQAEAERKIDEQLDANDQQFWSLYNQHLAPLKDAREVDGWQAAVQAMADGWVE